MTFTKLPFHADHIGSYIRPEALALAQSRFDAGTLPLTDLTTAQDTAIRDIVAAQQAHGVRSLTNGEFDRKYYFGGFFEKLQGFEAVEPVPWEMTRAAAPPIAALRKTGTPYPMAAVCVGKIRHVQSPYLESWEHLRACVPEEKWKDCKITMPPPCYFHLRLAPGHCYRPGTYDSDEAFFADLAAAYRKELKTLYDAGLRRVQIDDPTLAYFCSETMLQALRDEGIDPDALLETYLQAHNACLEGRPEGLQVGLHVCRGNFAKGVHFSAGSYERIAERLLQTLNYDAFLLEYDNARSGGFAPLRFLPVGKSVVLGLVTTKDAALEDKEEVKKRVKEAAEVVAKGQGREVEEVMGSLGVSPQCGFASVAVGAEGMTEEKMFAKLELVRDVAEELWPGEDES